MMKQEVNKTQYTCEDIHRVLELGELGFYELGAIYLHLSVCEGTCEREVEEYLENTDN